MLLLLTSTTLASCSPAAAVVLQIFLVGKKWFLLITQTSLHSLSMYPLIKLSER
uniref:Uncharacterized protein n=1 Tax=Arundo donax TaxID=35708 RepID=A0A0A8XWP3_ARUDO